MSNKPVQPLKQHTYITEARHEFSTLQRHIFYMLLAEMKEGDNKEKAPPYYPYYKINFHDLERRMGRKIKMDELIEASNGLVFKSYRVNKNQGGELSSCLISSIENLPEENSIELGVDTVIKPYLLELKKDYTEYELDTLLSLKSKYSKRMYEILSQYKEESNLQISVDELKCILGIFDTKTGEDIYSGWNMFEMNVLETPQKELKKHGDLEFTYDLIKTGKKYTDIVFHIKKKSNIPTTSNNETGIDTNDKPSAKEKKPSKDEEVSLKDELRDAQKQTLEKGIAQGQLAIIKNMLYNNHTITEVASLTGLTIDEIKKLMQNIN